MGEFLTISLFVTFAVVTVFTAYHSSQSSWSRALKLLPGGRRVPVEDLLLDLSNLATSRAPADISVEVNWNRYLESEVPNSEFSLTLRGFESDGRNTAQEGYHIVIAARSDRMPPFLDLKSGWSEGLLQELPEAQRGKLARVLHRHSLQVDGGAVRIMVELPSTPGGRVSRAEAESLKGDLEQALGAVEEVALLLTGLDEVAPRWLADQAVQHAGSKDGLAHLSALTRHYPQHEGTAAACENALERGCDAVCLQAALHPGFLQHLRSCLARVIPAAVPERLFLKALERVCATIYEAQDQVLMRRGLSHPSPKVIERSLLALRRAGHPLPAAELIALARADQSAGVERVVTRELGESEDPGATAALLELIERTLQGDTKRFDACERAVMALQRIGNTEAVPMLRALAEDDDGVFVEMGFGRFNPPRPLRAEARAAVETIQARIGPHQRGTLALTEAGQGGGLAIAEDAGTLALSAQGEGEEDER